jgi:outer membrane protein OmpA-like peptidoglycan-associated protein
MQRIMKKGHFLVAFSLLIVLAGCGGGKQGKSVKKDAKQVALKNMPLNLDDQATKVALFDEDLEMFVLDDADKDRFLDESSMKVASNEERLDFDWHEASTEDLATIYFNYDGRVPRKDQEANLKKADELVKKLAKEGKAICLKGHACKWRGTAAYNLAISQERPQTLREHFVNDLGISPDQIKTFGVGNEEPVVLAENKEGQAPNRRVEIYGVTV